MKSQKRLDEDNLSETEKNQILDELAARKLQREEISIHKTKGTIIRSKARWYNEGEKYTSAVAPKMTYSCRRVIHSYSMNWNNRNAEGL